MLVTQKSPTTEMKCWYVKRLDFPVLGNLTVSIIVVLISLYTNLVQWQSIYLTYIVFEEGSTFIPHLFLTIIYIKHEQLTCNDELDINDAVGCWL